MALKVPIVLDESAADLITGFGAGALAYLYSSATESGVFALVDTAAIVAGTQGYEVWDPDGTATTWYKSRVGDSGGVDFDVQLADAVAFQVGATDQYWTLTDWKNVHKVPDGDDDAVIALFVDAMNSEVTRRLGGLFLGPSTVTSRTFSGRRAVNGGTRLYIPGGIRSIISVEVADPGSAFETITAGDIIIGPDGYALRQGGAGLYLEFASYLTGSRSRFPCGTQDVRVTGALGPLTVDPLVASIVDRGISGMYDAWQSGGRRTVPTPSYFLFADDERTLRGIAAEHISMVR